jgi:hypothetical protein
MLRNWRIQKNGSIAKGLGVGGNNTPSRNEMKKYGKKGLQIYDT